MIATTNLARTDEEVKTSVVNELNWDTLVDASKVMVQVNNGIVTLTGTVPTNRARSAAGTDALSVLGVLEVENLLTVELPSVPAMPSDETIRSNAEDTLEWNAVVDAANIGVAVDGGVVTLTGTVPTHWEKTEAEEIVGVLRGVILVKNDLAVVPTEDVSDEIIAEEVVDALERNVLVDAEKVDVSVSRGTVTLQGEVPSGAARIAAFRAASRTAGVLFVQNNLKVRP